MDYFHRRVKAKTNRGPQKSEDTFELSQTEDRDSIIRVVTEFQITVENKRKSEVGRTEDV